MRLGRLMTRFTGSALGVFVIMSFAQSVPFAQDDHTHAATRDQGNTLVRVVRESTARFKDVAAAEAEGYALQFGCVSGPDAGAMGLHYVNPALLDDELDPTRPEILIYEPLPNGRIRLVGADYVVTADAWHAKHVGPPELMGQLFHLIESPHRFAPLPSFYTLHVWAWKESPTGAFVNWHRNVSCEAFSRQQ